MSRRWRVHCYLTWIPEQVRDDMPFVTRGNPVQSPMRNDKNVGHNRNQEKNQQQNFA
jgi:hypothetical protein